jgi:FixJ family two-component response regulator
MVLPEGDGASVAEQAVALRPGLKVMFMSGYSEHPVLQSPSFNRSVPFLQKPFTKAQLTGKVREALQ